MLRGARVAPRARVARTSAGASARGAYEVARTFVARVDVEREPTMALSEALRAHLPSEYASATSAKREIRRKNVLVNGAVRAVGDAVADGDVVEVLARTRPSSAGGGGAPSGRAGRRGGARRTQHFAIVVKPDDCASVGKGSDPMKWSAERLCATALTPTPEGVEGALSRPRPVHRLDELTGGLLVCAKTRMAMTAAVGGVREASSAEKVSGGAARTRRIEDGGGRRPARRSGERSPNIASCASTKARNTAVS